MIQHEVAVLALKNHEITNACLQRVRESGFHGPVLLVDNGSRAGMKEIAQRHGCEYHRNEKNRYVNPVWNWLFARCHWGYLTLLNNDCLVVDRYLEEKIWFGDDWIWGQLRREGFTCAKATNRRYIREVSGTLRKEPLLQAMAWREYHLASRNLWMLRLRSLAGDVGAANAVVAWKRPSGIAGIRWYAGRIKDRVQLV